MSVLHIDFETRSACDILSAGGHVYASHPTTDVLCLGFAFDDEPAQVLSPQGHILFGEEKDQGARVIRHLEKGLKVEAHNAAFEFLIWRHVLRPKYGWPELRLGQLHCTMARAYAMGLPGSLENASAAAGLTAQKDLAGSRIMKQVSAPRQVKDGKITWWEDEEKYQALYKYCAQDVEVEKELSKRLVQLSEIERQTWMLDQLINDRGVYLDIPAVRKAVDLVEYEQNLLNLKIRKLTDNVVGFCTETKRITDWIRSQGVECEGIAKDKMEEMLSRENLPPLVREVIEIRKLAAKSSNAKLSAMLNAVSPDNRVRGCFQYHGAATGRWAGRKIQFQNFPRPALSQAKIENFFSFTEMFEDVKSLQERVDVFLGPPLQVVSDSLRGFITARPGNQLYVGDFAQIEARVLAWLAGEDKVLNVFRDDGPIYELAASGIFGVPLDQVTKEQRQIGKVAVLALGYQGGKGAFRKMAANYGLKVSEEQADQIKIAWREANPFIVVFWRQLEHAAFQAVLHKGQVFKAGVGDRKIQYKVSGSFLWARLPSGRALCYPYPKIKSIVTPWGELKEVVSYRGVNSVTKKWEESYLYGGLQAENVTQAVARDLLRDALFRLEQKNYFVVSHVHDEAISEVHEGYGSVEEFNSILEEIPPWATYLPIKAESWTGRRYRK